MVLQIIKSLIKLMGLIAVVYILLIACDADYVPVCVCENNEFLVDVLLFCYTIVLSALFKKACVCGNRNK